jgi:hypothetical protein
MSKVTTIKDSDNDVNGKIDQYFPAILKSSSFKEQTSAIFSK